MKRKVLRMLAAGVLGAAMIATGCSSASPQKAEESVEEKAEEKGSVK